MNIFGEKFHSFGLDISDNSLKLISLGKKIGKYEVSSWNKINLKEGLIKDGEIINPTEISNQINELIKTSYGPLTSKLVVANLPESKTFLKVIKLTKEDFEESPTVDIIKNELPKHIPVPIEELNFDWLVIPSDDKSNYFIVIAAAPLKIIRQYTEVLHLAGLNVLALELSYQAAIRTLFFNFKNKNPFILKKETAKIIIDLGQTSSQLFIFDHGIVKFTNKLDFSSQDITQKIASELKINFSEAEKAKISFGLNPKKGKGIIKDILDDFITKLTSDIIKTMEYYKLSFPEGNEIEDLILIGGGANLLNLKENLKENLKKNIILGKDALTNLVFKREEKNASKNLSSLITTVGLALREWVE